MIKVSLLVSTIALTSVALASGCSPDSSSTEAEEFGQIQMALEGVAASGTTYRLIDAEFSITGPSAQSVIPAEGAMQELVDLPAGAYEVELLAGWTLTRVEGDGTLTSVDAELTSSNPQPFTISDGVVTPVQFAFDAGEDVTLGEGTLELSIAVNEDASSALLLGDFEGGTANADLPGAWFRASEDSADPLFMEGASAPEGNWWLRGTFPLPSFGVLGFESAAPFEVTNYTTLRFFYVGSGPIVAQMQTTETIPTENGGSCTGACWDGFAFALPESNSWTEAVIPLADFAQQGWGDIAPSGLTEVRSVQFEITGPAQFEIDYVRLE